MLSNCGHDENGRYSGGQAGDQSGTEWYICNWYRYNGGWQYCIHHPDASVRRLICDLACEAAANDNIGYDQYERYTFWQSLKQCGYHPCNIASPVETDCSAGVAAIVKCCGFLLGDEGMQSVSSECCTGDIRSALQRAGFEIRTGSEYLEGEDYLYAGDFLLREGNHICTCVTDGSCVESEDEDKVVKEVMKDARFEFPNGSAILKTVIADELNVRLAPRSDADIHPYWGLLKEGNKVREIATTNNGWSLVGISAGEGTGTVGYVASEFLG